MSILYIRDANGNFIPVPAIKGSDGYTPQKGVDYYTEADKNEMVQLVLAALPVAEEASF